MKKTYLLIVFSFLGSVLFANKLYDHYYQNNAIIHLNYARTQDSTKCSFTWVGQVRDIDDNKLTNFQVTVLEDNQVVQKINSKNKSVCNVRVPLYKEMTIILEKEGYVTKIFSVNSNLPQELCNKKYVLQYSALLFKKESQVDVSELQKPIAFIKYSKRKKVFYYDIKHVEEINKIIEDRYKEYYKNNPIKPK